MHYNMYNFIFLQKQSINIQHNATSSLRVEVVLFLLKPINTARMGGRSGYYTTCTFNFFID